MSKRGIDVRVLEEGKKEKISGNKMKELISIKNGINQDLGKKIVRIIKDSKIKVQASIQADVVRVSGAKRDDLQLAMQLLTKEIHEQPLQYENFRD
jgi:uncharacterized protein YajQ (UPF0234 family)